MPTYDFYCKKCENKVEVFCSMKQRECQKCQKCDEQMEQLLSDISAVTFENPGESSKWDNWGYRWGYNLNKAKVERAFAEKAKPKHDQKYDPYKRAGRSPG